MSKKTISIIRYLFVLSLFSSTFLNAFGQEKTVDPWYANKLLRIYHPNMRNWEVKDFDVAKFVEDCAAVNAEAIVVNAGGIYSYYPSKIEHHNPNPLLNGRDLFGEICEEAKKRNLKVIARLDFAGAATALAEDFSDWFHQRKDGSYKSHRGSELRFGTTPTGGYQNEEFAHKVIQELIDNYDIAGVHLNGSGFEGISYDKVSMDKYGAYLQGETFSNPKMAYEFNLWRQEIVTNMIVDYKKILHDKDENMLFMAEIAGAESPGWAYQKGFDNYGLSKAFTNLLLTTGRMSEDLYKFRYWVGLSAEMAHASRPDFSPIINLKVPTYKYSDFQKPIEEYKNYCYQAISHNAGLKLPTYGMLQTQQGTRSTEVLSSIFTFMKEREAYAINPRKISQVALVYPKKGVEDVMIVGEKPNMGLRNEFLGLYRAMVGKHMQFDVLYDHILMEYDLGKYDVVVVPSLVDFNDQEIKDIYQYMKKGGRLVMLDNSYTGKEFTEIPKLFQQLTGVKWTTSNGTGNYAVPVTDSYAEQDIVLGSMGLAANKSLPNYRLTEPSTDCDVWLNASLNNVFKGTPEDIGKMERGDNAVLWSKQIGEGDLVYFGNGLGEMMFRYDHPDYTDLLNKMIFKGGINTPMLTTNAPSTVEITIQEIDNGNLIQFVNGTGKTPLDQVISLSDITVSISKELPVKGMVHEPGKGGYTITGSVEQGHTTYTLKKLNDFAEIYIPFSR